MRSLLRTICLSLIVSASLCLAAIAQDQGPPDPRGRWNGIGVPRGEVYAPPGLALTAPPDPCRLFHMDIFSQEGERELHFTLRVPDYEWDRPIHGVVRLNKDGSVDIISRDPSHARAHGRPMAVGGTHVFFGEASYVTMKGETVRVLIGLLRNLGGDDWERVMPPPAFHDTWIGEATSHPDDGSEVHKMSLTLGNMVGSQFNGHSSFFDVFLPAVQMPVDSFFDVFTTVNGDGHMVGLGHERNENIWVLCDGSVRNSDNQLFGDGSVRGLFIWFEMGPGGTPMPFDFGPFKLLPAVQRM